MTEKGREMFSRRGFLKRFGIGVTAALALTQLPMAALEGLTLTDAGKRVACEFLRKIYNDYQFAHGIGHHPKVMHAGQELYEAFEGELVANERFISGNPEMAGVRHLRFKGAVLMPQGTGWRAEVVEAY